MPLNLAESRKIGFNDSVDVGGVSLHVQTEVLTRGGVVVRTTVYDGGVAKWARKEPAPADVTLEGLVSLAEAQHQRCLNHLKRAGAAWLESI